MFDTRPELDTHKEWEFFLTLMANQSDDMYGLFDFIRGNGALLLEGQDSYRIQPLFRADCWDITEWNEFRKEEMMPQKEDIENCLRFAMFLCKLARGEECESGIMSDYFLVRRNTPKRIVTTPMDEKAS